MGYYARAQASRDSRFARILDGLNYQRRDMQADLVATTPLDRDALAEKYKEKAGRAPHHTWDADKILEKICELDP